MKSLYTTLLTASIAATAAVSSYAQSTANLYVEFDGNYWAESEPLPGGGTELVPGDGDFFGTATLDLEFTSSGDIDLYEDYIWLLEVNVGGYFEINDDLEVFSFGSGQINLNDLFTGGDYFSIADATNFLTGQNPETFFAMIAAGYTALPDSGNLGDVVNALGLGPAPAELHAILYNEVSSFPNIGLEFVVDAPIFGEGYGDVYAWADINLTLVPVPEPSTYGLIGAGALVGLIGFRRFKARKHAA